jgi:UDP-N-acetyl-2-amino-2-deoxyglucuronate dehydrogenase
VRRREERKAEGVLELERARVRWFLSTDINDLPYTPVVGGKTTHRSIRVDGADLEFSEDLLDLHTRVYEDVLAGHGLGIDDARPAIELAHRIRTAPIETGTLARTSGVGA